MTKEWPNGTTEAVRKQGKLEEAVSHDRVRLQPPQAPSFLMKSKPSLLALTLLGIPIATHGQLFVVSGSLSYSLSTSHNLAPDAAFSFTDNTPTAYIPGSPLVGFPGGSRTVSSSAASANAGFGYTVGAENAGFSLTSGADAPASGLGSASASSEASLTCTFQVTTAVRASFNYGFQNYGATHVANADRQIDGSSHFGLALSSAGAGTLAQFNDSGVVPLTFGSVDLGILQPGETYTLTASTFAASAARSFSLNVSASDTRLSDLSVTILATPVPEPADFALVGGLGLVAVAVSRGRRQRG